MVVFLELSIPAAEFVLGRMLADRPNVDVELETVVPLGTDVMPMFWISGGDGVEQTLQEDPMIADVSVLMEADGRALYRIDWRPEIDTVVRPLVEADGEILEADATDGRWRLQLLFPDRARVTAFLDGCREKELDIDVLRVQNPDFSHEDGPITDQQRTAILTAYQNGYWEVPRKTTLADLAEKLSISDNSVSQRIRRGISTLVKESLVDDH